MNLALINVVMDGDYQYEQEVPLGICSLAAFLRHYCRVFPALAGMNR